MQFSLTHINNIAPPIPWVGGVMTHPYVRMNVNSLWWVAQLPVGERRVQPGQVETPGKTQASHLVKTCI